MIFKRVQFTVYLTACFIVLNEGKDLLFTPGPVTTTRDVKVAMTIDLSLTQTTAIDTLAYIRKALLRIDNLSPEKYVVVTLQGSGTFALEAVLLSATHLNGKALVLKNGHFGDNLENICIKNDIEYDILDWPDGRPINISILQQKLKENKYSSIAVVHHESSFSVMNPILEIGKSIAKYNPGATYIVDTVSSFGCYPIPMEEAGISFIVSTPNKCLEAFPGMGFIIARKDVLIKSKDNARSLVLDLESEYEELETFSSSRFTWPLQVYSALGKGIDLYLKEGRENRIKRYERNNVILRNGMKKLKFQEYRHENATRSKLLTVYKWPTNKAFDFNFFIKSLESQRMHIYAVSLTKTLVFRVANMGQLTEEDCRNFLRTVERTLHIMNVDDPNPE